MKWLRNLIGRNVGTVSQTVRAEPLPNVHKLNTERNVEGLIRALRHEDRHTRQQATGTKPMASAAES